MDIVNKLMGVGIVILGVLASDVYPQSATDIAVVPKAKYMAKVPGENKPKEVKGTLTLNPSTKILQFRGSDVAIEISYGSVTNLLYERAAKPRYGTGLLVAWPLLFTKSKKHYFTIQYQKLDGSGDFAIIQLDKSNYQMALAAAEAQIGKRIERTEER